MSQNANVEQQQGNQWPVPFSPEHPEVTIVILGAKGTRVRKHKTERTAEGEELPYYGPIVLEQTAEEKGRIVVRYAAQMGVDDADRTFPIHPQTGEYVFGKNVYRAKTVKELKEEGYTAKQAKAMLAREGGEEEYITKCLVPLAGLVEHPPLELPAHRQKKAA